MSTEKKKKILEQRWVDGSDIDLLTLDPHERYYEKIRLIRWHEMRVRYGLSSAEEAYGFVPKVIVYTDGSKELL